MVTGDKAPEHRTPEFYNQRNMVAIPSAYHLI